MKRGAVKLAGAEVFCRSRSKFFRRDRRFSGTEKSPIDKMLDRELRSNARRDLPLIVPPRRAGMEPIHGLTCWL